MLNKPRCAAARHHQLQPMLFRWQLVWWIRLLVLACQQLSWLVCFMLLSYMWFSKQWKRPSKKLKQLTALTQLQPELLQLEHVLQKFMFLAAKMTNTWVGNMQGPSPQEQQHQIHVHDGAPIIMDEPMASNFGWIVRLAVYHSLATVWPWSCCWHQHQKHAWWTYLLSFPSVRGMLTCSWKMKSAEELGDARLPEAEQ